MFVIQSSAQTTLINPAGDGGFESGNTFAANNWNDVQAGGGAANKWYVGTAAVNSGSRAVYISNNGGTGNVYNVNQDRVQHFYRDITFPAGQPYITLSFNWLGVGESCCDYMEVFLVPTTTTPAAATELTSGQIGVTYHSQSTWQTATISLPCTGIAGTTQRLVFSFACDGSFGSQPPNAVDNISLVSSATAPSCPTLMGTGFSTIASLPFSSGASTTCGSVNNVNSTNAVTCGSSFYMSSEDQVWSFIPTVSGAVNVALSSSTFNAGLYVYSGCPSNAACNGGTCVASGSGFNPTLSICVTAGTTYYVVLDG
ncbi:MAG: hypothetical protein ACRC3B_10940, partial [Bacteroidia bacterium]